jgi:transposase
MDERLQFVARRLNGGPMAELCREFGISRKTGYKIFDRYQECGVQGLTDRSRRPVWIALTLRAIVCFLRAPSR